MLHSETASGKHTYRLALYGRASSGKSCILAALGLGLSRIPHPESLSCVWIKDDTTIPIPPGGEKWKCEDPIPPTWDLEAPAITRHLGRQWMLEAVASLLDGDVPRASPINIAPFRFLYKFGEPSTGREFHVEMVDYSGELIRVEGTRDVVAKNLRAHLETMDGILVLAEAPRREEQGGRLHQEFTILLEAFNLLAEERRARRVPPFPVALVFNKWDRRSRMQSYSKAGADVELAEFLTESPPPPQLGLLHALVVASGGTVERPNCLPFALSAFGRAMLDTRVNSRNESVQLEVPVNKIPLCSYGLEDPFVWLCKRADQLEAERRLLQATPLRVWDVRQALRGTALSQVTELEQFVERFPTKSPERKRVKGLVTRARLIYARQVGFLVAVALVLFALTINLGFLAYDAWAYFSYERAAESSSAADSLEQWKASETYFASYAQANWSRIASLLFVRSPGRARRTLDVLRPRLSAATGVAAALEAIETPLLSDQEIPESTLGDLQKKLDDIRMPDGYNFLKVRFEKISGLLGNKKRDRDKDQETRKLYDTFVKYMNNNELVEAATHLSGDKLAANPQLKQELTNEFRERAPAKLKRNVEDFCQKQRPDWTSAEALVKAFDDSKDVHNVLQNQELFANLSNLSKWIDSHRREWLYRDWHFRKDEESAKRLLTLLPADDSYRTNINDYRAYEASLSTPQHWNVKISAVVLDHVATLEDGPKRSKPKLRVELLGKDESVEDVVEGEFKVEHSGTIDWPGSKLLRTSLITPREPFSLNITITQETSLVYFNLGPFHVGKSRAEVSILDLENPIQLQEVDPKAPYWSDYPGASPPRVVLSLDSPGLKPKPLLPDPTTPKEIKSVKFP